MSDDIAQKLAVVEAVLRGERPASDIETHGMTLGPAVSTEELRAQLLRELAAEQAFAERVDATWRALVAEGAEDGRRDRVTATFRGDDPAGLRELARTLGTEWASEGWSFEVADEHVHATTRPVHLGPEVVEVLLRTFEEAATAHGSAVEHVRIAPRRPWWKLW